jgi:formate dehydrogenase subunit beta
VAIWWPEEIDMAEFTKLSYKQGELNQVLSGFFGTLLEKKTFDAVMIPAKQPTKGVMQTLISRPDKIGAIDPFAPVVPLNAAKLVSALTATPSSRPVAAVLRSCEVRALIELCKLKQATLDNVVLFGLDCLGRYENNDFLKFQEKGGTTEGFLSGEKSDFEIAGACKMCEHPVADNVDVRLCVIGSGDAVWVEWLTERGNAVREKLGHKTEAGPKNRDSEVEALKKKRIEERDKQFAGFREATKDFQALQAHLAGCINCYNCRVACPVCYCKECVFVTDTFRHEGSQYMGWADKRGALKMPVDSLFYHLTRLTHMSTLCVGCGQCTSACPNDIQLAPLFRAVAEKTQARFDYLAGRSPDEAQPLATFHDDELVEVTGQVK